ncbi:TetR/AcrR family transcriptional regulator [Gordonia sp. NPDC058843]|uniref:TetR/AcrR family transcriptional regulator n=1 Tax=Gordonia sp. NPDC058843 TaxID=3346648 RepID=UPI0036744807
MARRTGWGGSLPVDDADAAKRIIDATRVLIETTGSTVTLTDVTKALQVTRQTVYRYYPGIDALLQAVALDIGSRLADQLVRDVGDITEPSEAIVELMACTIERVRGDRAVMYLLTTANTADFSGGITDDISQEFAVAMLRRLEVDWAAAGLDDAGLRELSSWLLLIIDAFVSSAREPLATGPGLRSYLRTWLAPAIDALVLPATDEAAPSRPGGVISARASAKRRSAR